MPLFRRKDKDQSKKGRSSNESTPEMLRCGGTLKHGRTDDSPHKTTTTTTTAAVLNHNISTTSSKPGAKLPEVVRNRCDLGWTPPSTPTRSRSRLNHTLEQILNDDNALPSFIQYLEACRASHLVLFWLTANSFQAAVLKRVAENGSSITSGGAALLESFHASISVESIASSSSVTNAGGGETHGNRGSLNNLYLSNSSNSISSFKSAAMPDVVPAPGRSVVHDSPSSRADGCYERHGPQINQQQQLTSRTAPDPNSDFNNGYSTDSQAVPTDSQAVPTDSQAVPTDSQAVPTDSQAVPTDSQAVPTESQAVPTESQGTLSDGVPTDSLTSVEVTEPGIHEDAIHIFSKYICKNATSPIGVSDITRNDVVSRICGEDGDIDPDCFVPAQNFIVQRLQVDFFPEFIRSEHYCKYRIELLTSRSISLEDILFSETAMFYFMEYMESESAMKLIEFWITIDNFHQQLNLGNYTSQEAEGDAIVIYEKYFSLQATTPLGFPTWVRPEVETNICTDDGPIPDCFSTPMKIILQKIEQDYFQLFLRSDLYLKYLSELINSAKIENDPLTAARRCHRLRRGSGSSSEHSYSSGNTLLAEGHLHTHSPSSDTIKIETGYPDPDALWKRPKNKYALTFGMVSELGQYIPTYDSDPAAARQGQHISTASRFSKALKKIVTKDEDKAKEEMAWRIAEMIVSDVTNQAKGLSIDPADSDDEMNCS